MKSYLSNCSHEAPTVSLFSRLEAKLGVLYRSLPTNKKVVLYIDDVENSYRCIGDSDPELARAYLSHRHVVETYLKMLYPDCNPMIWCYGPAFLRDLGFPQHIPLTESLALKNSADIRLAADSMQLPWSVSHVIIASSDSDFTEVSAKLKSKSIEVLILPFGKASESLLQSGPVLSSTPLRRLLSSALDSDHKPSNPQANLTPIRNAIEASFNQKEGCIHLSEAGVILRKYGAHERNWMGHGSCKQLTQYLLKCQSTNMSECGHFVLRAESVKTLSIPVNEAFVPTLVTTVPMVERVIEAEEAVGLATKVGTSLIDITTIPEKTIEKTMDSECCPFTKVGEPELPIGAYRKIFSELAIAIQQERHLSINTFVKQLKSTFFIDEIAVSAPAVKYVVDRSLRQNRKHKSAKSLAESYMDSVFTSCRNSGVKLSRTHRKYLQQLVKD